MTSVFSRDHLIRALKRENEHAPVRVSYSEPQAKLVFILQTPSESDLSVVQRIRVALKIPSATLLKEPANLKELSTMFSKFSFIVWLGEATPRTLGFSAGWNEWEGRKVLIAKHPKEFTADTEYKRSLWNELQKVIA